MAELAPSPKQQFFDNAGNPAAGYKLTTYAAGTTTPQATFTDRAASASNPNPIVLNQRGEAVIFLDPALVYDFKFESPDGSQVWTQAGVSDASGLADLASEDKGAGIVRFIQNLPGAISQWVRDKLRQTVHVEDFGVIGDGVTDDTAALSTAILSSVGRNLDFGRGTYVISAGLPINSNCHWTGDGATVRMKSNLASIPGTLVNLNYAGDFSNISIRGITFDSNRQNNVDHGTPDANGNQPNSWDGAHAASAVIANVTNLRLVDCTFTNSWGSGVLLNSCKRVKVLGCDFTNIRRVGLAIQNPQSRSISVVGNHAENCTVGFMVIDGGHDIAFSGNTTDACSDRARFPSFAYSGEYPNVWPSTGGFKAFGTAGYVNPAQPGDGSGIELTGSTDAGVSPVPAYNITITGNTCNNGWVGVRAEGQNYGVAISGNVCRGNEGPGIFMFSAQETSVTGNTCNGNLIGIQSLQGGGIAQRPRYNAYTGNICRGNSQHGMQLGGEADSAVTGNTLCGNGSGSGFQSGLSLVTAYGQNCERNLISGNTLEANSPVGLGFDGTAHTANYIHGNIILNNSLANLHQPSPGYPFSTNTVRGNIGAKTSGYGNATLTAGQTSVTVNHGLEIAPDGGRLSVFPVTDPQGKQHWVHWSSITATQFTISINSAAASDIIFNWNAA